MKKTLKYIIFALLLMLSFLLTAEADGQYTVTYDMGAAQIRSEYITNTNPSSVPASQTLTLTEPSCPGFEFKGWYKDNSHTVPITQIPAGTDSDITLYAKWYEKSYSISYVLVTPGITITQDDISHTNPVSRLASENTYLSSPVCTSGNYIFAGWYSDSNFTEPVTDIREYTCENITIYAKWENAEYDVHYMLGTAQDSLYKLTNNNPDFYEYSKGFTLSDIITKDPALTFDGWYSDEAFTHKVTRIEADCSGTVVLYAKWIVKNYNISYILADASGIDTSSVTHTNPSVNPCTTELVLSSPISTDKSYSFVAWYTSPDFAPVSRVTSIPKNTYDDITLYAKWEIAVYKIKYDYGNINQSYLKIDNPNATEYKFGDEISFAPIEAAGYIFNSWCTDSTLRNSITTLPEGTYGDIMIYADMTEMTYSINYVLGDNGVDAARVVNSDNPHVRTTSEQISLKTPRCLDLTYDFGGWYTDEALTQEIEYIRAYTTGNITLYAKWVKDVPYIPVWGDATLSDELSAADARIVLRYSAGLETSFSQLQFTLSDINRDSKVNASDARLVLRISAGMDKIEDIKENYSLPDIEEKDGEIVFTEKTE